MQQQPDNIINKDTDIASAVEILVNIDQKINEAIINTKYDQVSFQLNKRASILAILIDLHKKNLICDENLNRIKQIWANSNKKLKTLESKKANIEKRLAQNKKNKFKLKKSIYAGEGLRT